MIEIPLQKLPHQEFSIVLDGQNCVLELRQMGSFLYLTLTADEVKICDSHACQSGEPIPVWNTPLFSGRLFFQDGNGKLKAMVVPDYEQAEAEGVDKNDLPQIMQNNLTELNSLLAAYERVSEIIIYPTEFEKTPKRSIQQPLEDGRRGLCDGPGRDLWPHASGHGPAHNACLQAPGSPLECNRDRGWGAGQ